MIALIGSLSIGYGPRAVRVWDRGLPTRSIVPVRNAPDETPVSRARLDKPQ